MSINERNYEEYLIRYMENELDEEERKEVELYMLIDRAAEEDWNVLKHTKLTPEKVSFPNKALLFRDEDKDKKAAPVVRKIGWWYAASAVAAMVALVLVFTLINQDKPKEVAIITPEKVIENKADGNEHVVPEIKTQDIAVIAPEIEITYPVQTDAKQVQNTKLEQEIPAVTATATVAMVEIKPQERSIETASLPAIASIEVPKVNTQAKLAEYSAPEEDAPGSLLEGMARIVRKNIAIKHKKTADNQSVIALSFQTENVSLSKTFKYNF